MMAEGGMALYGSQPHKASPDVYSYDPHTQSSSPFTKTYSVSSSKTNIKTPSKTQNGGFDSIFENGQNTGRKTPSSGVKKSKSLVKTKASYVDELLFGAVHKACGEGAGGAPWESARTPTPGLGVQSLASTARSTSRCDSAANGRTQTPSLSQSLSSPAKPRKGSAKRYRTKHEPSYVDEMLFGPKKVDPGFNAPWEDADNSKPRLYSLDCTDYKKAVKQSSINRDMFAQGRSSQLGSHRSETSRPASRVDSRMSSRADDRPPSARPASRQAGPRPPSAYQHRSSYVDETLFGPKPAEADWPAPWEDAKESRKKPLIFGSTDVKVTINHDIETCKERPRKDLRSAGAGVRKPPANTGARPVWK